MQNKDNISNKDENKFDIDDLLGLNEEELEKIMQNKQIESKEKIKESDNPIIFNHKKETDLMRELKLDDDSSESDSDNIFIGKKLEKINEETALKDSKNNSVNLNEEEYMEVESELKKPFDALLNDDIKIVNSDSEIVKSKELVKDTKDDDIIELDSKNSEPRIKPTTVTTKSNPVNTPPTPPNKNDNWFTKKSMTLVLSTAVIFSGILAFVALGNNDSDASLSAEKYALTETKNDLKLKETSIKENQNKIKEEKDLLAKKESKLNKEKKALEKKENNLETEKNNLKRTEQNKVIKNTDLQKDYFAILGGSTGLVGSVNSINKSFDTLSKDTSIISSANWKTEMKSNVSTLSSKVSLLKSLSSENVTSSHQGSFSALHSSISYLESSIETINKGLTSSDLYSMSDANSSLVNGAIYLEVALQVYESEMKELELQSNLASLKVDTTMYFTDTTISSNSISSNYSNSESDSTYDDSSQSLDNQDVSSDDLSSVDSVQ